MLRDIRQAAVLGAGVMGAAIAAHLANCGIDCYLFDIVPRELTEEEEQQGKTLNDPEVRNRFALRALKRLQKEKPSPIYTKGTLDRITVGNFDDDLDKLAKVDWIIEAVVEDLSIKRQLLNRVENVWQQGTVVSSNTSGISITQMVAQCSPEFQKHFMGTHFFNPPRYMKLLEVIPTEATDRDLVQFMSDFGRNKLGKGVVMAKDTPNFIANRIGVYGLLATYREMAASGLTPEQVDAITGPALGRPKSATFRTLDLVGLDTFVHVADNVRQNVDDKEEQEAFDVPAKLRQLVEKGWLGEKSGQGFYRKIKGKGGRTILSLNLETMDYQPREKLRAMSLEAAKRAKTLPDKLKTLIYAEDVAGKFAWNITKRVLLYSAAKVPEIADDIADVDLAMKWGFNWKLGPFEMWDALGVERAVERMRAEGETIPAWVEDMLASGRTSFYERIDGLPTVFTRSGDVREVAADPRTISLAELKTAGKLIKGNRGASLIDIGDDVVCLEFHSPKNAIASDIVAMMNTAVKEVAANYRGLVIGNHGSNFCVGANLMMILMEAQDDNWTEIEWVVRQFQDATMALKACPRPVVAAPFAMTLGGGAEVCFPADRVQAAAETYMGLVEVGVGLIPGGGGTKEMLIRYTDGTGKPNAVGLQGQLNQAFERIAMAQVSTSAAHARELGYLRPQDRITVNGDYLLFDAKQSVLELDAAGYEAKGAGLVPVLGESGYNTLKLGAYGMLKSGYISEHDYKIASKLAYVLAGGDVPEGTYVTEQYLLDLEREAFLSLVGEPKSQARMQHMLTKNKPLRN